MSLKVFCDNWRSGRQAGRQTWNAADSLESFSTKGFMTLCSYYVHVLYTIIRKRGTQQTCWKVFQPKDLCSYYIYMCCTQLYVNLERSRLPGDSILYLCRENFVSASNLIFCHNLNSHLKPKRVLFYIRYSEDEDWAQDRLDLYCRYNNTASQPHSEGV